VALGRESGRGWTLARGRRRRRNRSGAAASVTEARAALVVATRFGRGESPPISRTAGRSKTRSF